MRSSQTARFYAFYLVVDGGGTGTGAGDSSGFAGVAACAGVAGVAGVAACAGAAGSLVAALGPLLARMRVDSAACQR